ncbi:MAG: EamA family transporter RarD [Thermodesulfobacteriota bacterium]
MDKSVGGLISALSAYMIWGFTPIYFKTLKEVPPFEILMHRMVWSFILLLMLVWIFRRTQTFLTALKNLRTMGILLGTTLIVGLNWFLFIWAINNNRILDASLGYFICPLVNVILGALILRERLRHLQWAAVLFAAASVFYLTLTLGAFPWVSLTLAFSFGFYGLIRKTAPVEALEGLAIETLLMFIPAVLYLWWLDGHADGTFLRVSGHINLLLMGTALATAVPLLLFNLGARRLHLATIGFLQYIAPSCTFVLAVFIYHEPFSTAKALAFAVIWAALGLYSYDTVIHYRTLHRVTG